MQAPRVKVIACATVAEELHPRLPVGIACQTLDFGLHIQPTLLKEVLQDAIDTTSDADAIVLAYGLCSLAVIGLRSERSTLVIPRVDDCISIFLGSRQAYQQQSRSQPGTYYLTKGWIEVADTPFDEHERMVQKYGDARAKQLMDLYLRHYTRLALIDTGQYQLDRYREYARAAAQRFGLRFEEIRGSTAMIEKMVAGPWDDEFVVVQPGRSVTYADFLPKEGEI